MLTAVLAEATGGSVLDFARRVLFEPLGVRTRPADEGVERLASQGPTPAWSPAFRRAGFAWATDRQGVLVGGALLKLTASDLLRFGQLHLDRGRWDGQEVVSAGWVAEAVRPVDVPTDDPALSYGYLWWLMELDGHDAYAASCAFGQAVVIVPDLRLVVAMACADDVSPPMDGAKLVPILTDVVIPRLEGKSTLGSLTGRGVSATARASCKAAAAVGPCTEQVLRMRKRSCDERTSPRWPRSALVGGPPEKQAPGCTGVSAGLLLPPSSGGMR